MSKKNINKGGGMLLGALVGSVLGVAAGMLASSESGKKIGKKMAKDARKLSGDFYRYIAPRMKKLKAVGEKEYNAFMAEGAKKYSKARKLSLEEEKILAGEAKRSWGHIKKHLR